MSSKIQNSTTITISLFEVALAVLGEAQRRDIVGQGVDPDVHHVLAVSGDGHAPREGSPDSWLTTWDDLTLKLGGKDTPTPKAGR